jgi:hypothetical protein
VGIMLSNRFWTHLQGYNKRFQPPLVVQPDLVQVPRQPMASANRLCLTCSMCV